MREKYESLALVQLKELAKVRGLKGTSSMKKADLVEAMLAEDERVKQKESLEKEAENPQKAEPAPEQSAPRKKTVVTNTRAAAPRQRERMDRNQNGTANGNRRRTERREVPADGSGGFASQSSRPEGSGSSGHQSSRPEGSGSSVPQTSRPEGGNVSASQVSRPEGGSASASLTSRPEGGSISASQVSRPEGGSVSASQTSRPEGSGALAAQSIRPDAAQAQRTGRTNEVYDEKSYPKELDSGEEASGILEVMPDGYGFIRCANYMPGENDVYVAPSQIRRFGLKTGDILRGNKRVKTQQEKFSALLFIRTINGYTVEEAAKRKAFEDMTPIFPDQRIRLETPGCSIAMRAMDLVSPVGKGQRGMIVSPPKAGKTTLLKEVAKSILRTNPHMHMLILLIDERPEEVTDIKEAISGSNVEVIYSTFDELPEHHKRVSEMVIERAKRLVEHKKEVVILLDSITRLARAYNLVVPPSGRTLSGGLDPAALHMPKRFFGAARNMREGGSLTILATALVDTGSKMDDVIYEEFKGTGNMELILDRKLSEKRIFPAIDLAKSGTRREDLLLNPEELDAINIMRKALNGLKADEAADRILEQFTKTRNNNDFVQMVKRNKFI